MRPLIVAIDAGHGGQDPGAIGKSGRREKDVTLAVSRALARQVKATPGLQAYLTRDKDVFIPPHRRAQLARAAQAIGRRSCSACACQYVYVSGGDAPLQTNIFTQSIT